MWLVHRKLLKKLVYNSFGIIGKFVLHEFNHTLCAFQMVLVVKNPPTKAGDIGDVASIPGLGISSVEGNGNSLQNSCLEKSHGQRSLVGYSPWGCKELDTTKVLPGER